MKQEERKVLKYPTDPKKLKQVEFLVKDGIYKIHST